MKPKNPRFYLTIIIVAGGILGTIAFTQNSAYSATKLCNFTDACAGSSGGDTMAGDGKNNWIVGCGGDDVINGGDGKDFIGGDLADGPGQTDVCKGGSNGADRLDGGPGDDLILQSAGEPGSGTLTASDGHKDIINCGPGNDVAWINVSVDNDVALNCETIHAG